jgi:hypothetical protein
LIIPGTVTNLDLYALEDCPNLAALLFRGNAPTATQPAWPGLTNALAYYLPGSSGWGTNFGGLRAAPWLPLALPGDPQFGIRNARFGFNVAWASGRSLVLEACSNLASPQWIPISTNTFSGDSLYVSDSAWTNFSGRLYRVRSP